jgi:hypothetical protein
MASKHWSDSLRDLAQDLVTIEVNTIESTEISGRKMPSFSHALIDIAQKYADFMSGPAVGLKLDAFASAFRSKGRTETDTRFKIESPIDIKQRTAFREQGGEALDEEMSDIMKEIKPKYEAGGTQYTVRLTNGWETFELLRWAANKTIASAASKDRVDRVPGRQAEGSALIRDGILKIDRSTRGILWRIARNCDQLKVVTDELQRDKDSKAFMGMTRRELVNCKAPLKPVSPQHLTRIRKAWDLGTDTIVLQTVVQLDGDITFRARPYLLREGRSPLLEAHERATSAGLDHWQNLFKLVFSLIIDKIGRIFAPRG